MIVRTNNNFSKSFDGLMKELFNEFPSAVSKTVREDVLHFPPVNISDSEKFMWKVGFITLGAIAGLVYVVSARKRILKN